MFREESNAPKANRPSRCNQLKRRTAPPQRPLLQGGAMPAPLQRISERGNEPATCLLPHSGNIHRLHERKAFGGRSHIALPAQPACASEMCPSWKCPGLELTRVMRHHRAARAGKGTTLLLLE